MSVEILSINVSSELETLCEAQLRGTWQVPAELVRLALRLGAAEISVQRSRRGFVVGWQGPLISFEVLADLQSALDPRREGDDRQHAIAALELSGLEGLLWATGLRGARIQVECSDSGRRWTFEHRHRGRPRLARGNGGNKTTGVEIRWRCAGLDQRRSLKWLAIAARFAPVKVLIDGRSVPQGFAGGLYHLRLEEPVPCRIGLTRSGDEPVLWLLRDGVVSSRASIPGYPSFEAAVELGSLVAPGASAADMRRAVTPFLGALVDRAVWMMMEVSDRLPRMAEQDRERLGLLLLRAACRGLRAREIRRIPLVRNAADGGLLSVEEIHELADRRGRLLAAIDADEVPGGTLVDPRSTLVASSETRGLLTELTAVRFQSPSRRLRSLSTRVGARIRAFAEMVKRRVRGLFARRPLPVNDLRPREAELLAALHSAVSPLAVEICEGRGAVGRTARGVVVPRLNPAMTAGAALAAADAFWLYPLLLALDTGEELSEDLRRRWLESTGAVSIGE